MGRLLLFAIPILLIVGVAIGAIGWYAQHSYFVAFDSKHQVVIYQGRPGGLLFWDPKPVRETRVDQADLTPIGLGAVRAKRDDFNSLKGAAAFVKRESSKARAKRVNSTTSTSSTTTISSTTSTSAP